jgi:hypothetical protein
MTKLVNRWPRPIWSSSAAAGLWAIKQKGQMELEIQMMPLGKRETRESGSGKGEIKFASGEVTRSLKSQVKKRPQFWQFEN